MATKKPFTQKTLRLVGRESRDLIEVTLRQHLVEYLETTMDIARDRADKYTDDYNVDRKAAEAIVARLFHALDTHGASETVEQGLEEWADDLYSV